MKIAISYFVILRVLLGSLFIVSGFEKAVGPYQNFLYVVQTYDFLPAIMEEWVARLLPWGELFLGLFMMVGCWLQWMLRAVMCLTAAFICVVGQALIRGINISECGCFGDLISFPPYAILVFDSFILVLALVLLIRLDSTSLFSLDHHFEKV